MKHKNYFENYTYEDVLSRTARNCRKAQTEMIQRAHPEYDEENDWVLWLVLDVYDKCNDDELEVLVNIKKQGDIEVPFVPILRKPYPNIHIHQVALYPSDNRKRVYGIPLVFKTFEEISEIKEVSVKWIKTFLRPLGDSEEQKCVFAEVMNVKYNVCLEKSEKHPEHHMFTIYSYDRFCNSNYEEPRDIQKEKNEYYDEFDEVVHINVLSSVKMNRIVKNKTLILKNKKKIKHPLLIKHMQNKYANHFKETPEGLVVFHNVKTILWRSDLKEYFGYSVTCCETDEVLTATYLAGVLPEPSFGFK